MTGRKCKHPSRLELALFILLYIAVILTIAVVATAFQPGGPF